MNIVASIIKKDDKFIVKAIDEFESLNYIDDMRVIMKVDYLIVVDDKVHVGDTYDPETDNFINPEGIIVFNSMTDTKRIELIERKLNEPEPVEEFDINKLSRDEQYEYIIKQIKADCERVILTGFNCYCPIKPPASVDINNEEEMAKFKASRKLLHYSLSLNKQKDLENTIMHIRRTKESDRDVVFWRDDSRVMLEKYSVEEFIALYNFLTGMITTCKIRSDGLEQYVTDKYNAGEDFIDINWNTKLPDDIISSMSEQINVLTRSRKAEYYLNHMSTINYKKGIIEFH